MLIGPGTPLICISLGVSHARLDKGFDLTLGALYSCEEIIPADWIETLCPDCNKACDGLRLRGKLEECSLGYKVVYCSTLFHPLNDGDTSLVEEEKEKEDLCPA
jgi:hypothetical protein